METGTKIRGVSWSFKRRNHRHVARLPLQLDSGVSFDETRRRGPSAVHGHGGIRDQTAATNADKWFGLALREDCRSWCQSGSDRRSRHGRRNVKRGRKSLRDLPRNFRRSERRSPGVSPLVVPSLLDPQWANLLCRRPVFGECISDWRSTILWRQLSLFCRNGSQRKPFFNRC